MNSKICLDHHPIIRRFDARREFAFERLVVEIEVEIGEDGVAGLYAADPGERGLDVGVGGMRRVAQRIENPAVDVRTQRKCATS